MMDHGLASNPWHVKDQQKLTQYAASSPPARPAAD